MNWYHSSDLAVISLRQNICLVKINDYDKNIIVSIAGGAHYSIVCDHLCVAALLAGMAVARLINWRALP